MLLSFVQLSQSCFILLTQQPSFYFSILQGHLHKPLGPFLPPLSLVYNPIFTIFGWEETISDWIMITSFISNSNSNLSVKSQVKYTAGLKAHEIKRIPPAMGLYRMSVIYQGECQELLRQIREVRKAHKPDINFRDTFLSHKHQFISSIV